MSAVGLCTCFAWCTTAAAAAAASEDAQYTLSTIRNDVQPRLHVTSDRLTASIVCSRTTYTYICVQMCVLDILPFIILSFPNGRRPKDWFCHEDKMTIDRLCSAHNHRQSMTLHILSAFSGHISHRPHRWQIPTNICIYEHEHTRSFSTITNRQEIWRMMKAILWWLCEDILNDRAVFFVCVDWVNGIHVMWNFIDSRQITRTFAEYIA